MSCSWFTPIPVQKSRFSEIQYPLPIIGYFSLKFLVWNSKSEILSMKFLEQYIQSNMQYAQLELNSKNHYHLRHNSNETGMCSILVYQADRIIIDNEQERFWKCSPSKVKSKLDAVKVNGTKDAIVQFLHIVQFVTKLD